MNKFAEIIKNAEVQEGMKVLDVGCGPGRVTIPCSKKVGESGKVIALDIQQKMLDKVKAKALKENVRNIEYVCSSIINYQGDNFDRVIMVTVIGEIPNQKDALEVLYEALKQDGMLCITEIMLDPHFQSSDYIIELAQSVGFVLKEIKKDWVSYSVCFLKE